MTTGEKQDIIDIIKVTLLDEQKTNSKEHIQLNAKLDSIDKKLCGMNKNVDKCKTDINEIIVDRTRQSQALFDWKDTRSQTCPKEERLDNIVKEGFSAKAMKKYNAKLFTISTIVIGILLTLFSYSLLF